MIGYEKKGISLVSALLIVVVIAILTGTLTISTNHIIMNTYKKEFVSEYNLVQSAVNDYIMRNSGEINFEETQFDLSSVDSANRSQFEDENTVNNRIDMYIIDLEKIGVYNPTYGTGKNGEDDIYMVSKNTKKVYYKKGFVHGDDIFYKGIEY